MTNYKEFIQVYIPNLKKKRIILGEENLSDFERTLLVMIDLDKSSAAKLAKGDEILMSYIDEANDVKNTDASLREAYDHEAEMVKSAKEEGQAEGRAEGFAEGQKKKEIEMIKKMFADGVKADVIMKYSTLSKEEIEDICHKP